jgi:DNA helicase II / ATP-dependent DNA helicase PcrA
MRSDEFNLEQNAIVRHVKGAILVLAPVGTGKTSVLVERISQAINTGISPKRILCLITVLPRSTARSND